MMVVQLGLADDIVGHLDASVHGLVVFKTGKGEFEKGEEILRQKRCHILFADGLLADVVAIGVDVLQFDFKQPVDDLLIDA
jgi:hypothetical protein